MSELPVPDRLKGSWEHALVLTYGADIPFFENAIFGLLAGKCRNRVILADGERLLESYERYARDTRLARHLNQRYVVEGVFAPGAAHAKAILLVNPESGRLLVGSGNLSLQGYGSGGELFTEYSYRADESGELNAFAAVRQFVDGLIDLGYARGNAIDRIRHLWEKTQWLYLAPRSDAWPVRHNLETSFLAQLRDAVGSETVNEVWVLSPFYDPMANAAERLLVALSPRKATFLVQPARTCVKLEGLQRIADRFGHTCEFRSLQKGERSVYVHAKLYLIKLENRSICFHGSPNLSNAAMLMTARSGNAEMANLLVGECNEFDYLLEQLDIGEPIHDLASLELEESQDDSEDVPGSARWRLAGGQWRDTELILRVLGDFPDADATSIVLTGAEFVVDLSWADNRSLKGQLPPEAAERLGRAVPLVLRVTAEGEVTESNPVYICNSAALDRELQVATVRVPITRIADLDIDDQEIGNLLGQLEEALVIDTASIWRMAGKMVPDKTGGDDDEGPRLTYDDIDYDVLRQHPKLKQYTSRGKGQAHAKTRLQMILNAIIEHFKAFTDASVQMASLDEVVKRLGAEEDQEDIDEQTQREDDDARERLERRRRTEAERTRRLLKSFIRRYLRGIRAPDFREFVGFEVMGSNYIIFTHLLWRLLAKDWVEPEYLLSSSLTMWKFLWGETGHPGYFTCGDEEQKEEILSRNRETVVDAKIVAMLYHGARTMPSGKHEDLVFALRDFLRWLLEGAPFGIDEEVLVDVSQLLISLYPLEVPMPGEVVSALARLARFETTKSFLRVIERELSVSDYACEFTSVKLKDKPVKSLVVKDMSGLKGQRDALRLLMRWMSFEKLEDYRIAVPDADGSGRMLLYEVAESSGVYWDRYRGRDPIEFGRVVPLSYAWEPGLERLGDLARWAEKVLQKRMRRPASTRVLA